MRRAEASAVDGLSRAATAEVRPRFRSKRVAPGSSSSPTRWSRTLGEADSPSSRASASVVLLLCAALTPGCDDPGEGSIAPSSNPPPPGFLHLVDQARRVQSYHGPLERWTPVGSITHRVERVAEIGSGPRTDAIQRVELPWPPADPSALRLTLDGVEVSAAETLESAEGPAYSYHPASRDVDLASALEGAGQTGQIARVAGAARRRFDFGEVATWRLVGLASSAHAELWARRVSADADAITVEWAGEVVEQLALSAEWQRIVVPLPPRESPLLRVSAPEETETRSGLALAISQLRIEADGPDVLLVRADEGETRVELTPRRVPSVAQLAAGVSTPRAISFVSPGGPLLVRFFGARDASNVGAVTVDGVPGEEVTVDEVTVDGVPLRHEEDGRWTIAALDSGLRTLRWSGGGSNLVAELEQPFSDLPLYLHDPIYADDDFEAELGREGGTLPAAVSDRLIRRLWSGEEARLSFLLPPPSTLEIALTVESGDELRFALGLATNMADEQVEREVRGTVETTLEWRAGGKTVALGSYTTAAGTGWNEHRARFLDEHDGEGTLVVRSAQGELGTAVLGFGDPVLAPSEQRRPPREHPNVLVYLIDTLRADGLSCLGAGHPTTPVLDELAKDGYLFPRFRTIASWTRPAVASLMTGMQPHYHGVLDSSRGLPRDLVTLAEQLRAAGVSSWAGVTNMQVGARGVHFTQGFHRFAGTRDFEGENGETSAQIVSQRYLPWSPRQRRRTVLPLPTHRRSAHALRAALIGGRLVQRRLPWSTDRGPLARDQRALAPRDATRRRRHRLRACRLRRGDRLPGRGDRAHARFVARAGRSRRHCADLPLRPRRRVPGTRRPQPRRPSLGRPPACAALDLGAGALAQGSRRGTARHSRKTFRLPTSRPRSSTGSASTTSLEDPAARSCRCYEAKRSPPDPSSPARRKTSSPGSTVRGSTFGALCPRVGSRNCSTTWATIPANNKTWRVPKRSSSEPCARAGRRTNRSWPRAGCRSGSSRARRRDSTTASCSNCGIWGTRWGVSRWG